MPMVIIQIGDVYDSLIAHDDVVWLSLMPMVIIQIGDVYDSLIAHGDIAWLSLMLLAVVHGEVLPLTLQ